jgi:hypothetical protein
MVTAYSPILKLALPVQGELSGTWGDVVNDNITSMVEQAIAGRAVIDTWTTNSHVLTTANGTTSESRCAMLEFTDTGTALSGAGTVTCPTLSKIYIAKNASGQNVTLKTSGGTGILVPNGRTMFLFCDGTNVVEAVTSTTSLQLGTSTIVTAVLDEDNMASDSATSLATQQSIKAYVDSQVGANNELSEVLANGNTSGANDIIMTSGQKITTNTIDETTAASGVTIDSVLLKDDGVNATNLEITNIKANDGTAAGSIADSTGVVTVLSSILTTADINGGTADGVIIGGTTPAAATVTNLIANTDLIIAGTTTITAVLDEDNMASDSAAALATQQSIKAYVDSQVGTVDTLAEILAIGNTTGGTDIVASTTDKVQFRDAAIYINSSVDGQLDIVADTEIQIAATTVDLNGNLDVSGTALVTGVLTTTAATVFNGGFASNAASTITTADNLSGLIVACTDADANTGPTIQLKRDSSTTAANDLLGNLIFVGENDADEATVYANIGSQNQVITNGSESGRFFINTIVGGTEYSRFFADATETVINENSRDLDFRVESDSQIYALFVEGSSGNVGIGTSSPARDLHINGTATNAKAFTRYTHDGLASTGLDVGYSSGGYASIYNAENTSMLFSTNATERMRIDSSGNVGIGVTPSAWRSAEKVIQLSDGAFYTGSNYVAVGQNYYIPAAGGATYIESDYASDYYQIDGTHVWRTAASGTAAAAITWSESMRIDSSGNVGIGTSSPAYNFVVSDGGNFGFEFGPNDGGLNRIYSYDRGTSAYKDFKLSASQIIFGYGSSGTNEAMRIDSSGNVIATSGSLNLVGTNTQMFASANGQDIQFKFAGVKKAQINNGGLISAGDGSEAVPGFRFTDDPNTGMFRATTDTLAFSTAASEAMRIDSSQRVLIGLTTSEAVASTTAADLQVVTGGIGVSIVSTAGASGPAGILALGHKRGAGGVVLDDDGLGDIRFAGHDGTDLESQAAIIRASVDGTPGSNDMPGRLEFYTTADGAAASTERMRINSAGDVKIGSAGTPQTKLQVQSGSIENGTILMGANYNGTGMNQNSEKSGALHHPVYVSDTSPKGYRLIGGYADSTRNMVQIGGGTNSAKAATQIVLYTGASATASSNTEAMRIDSLQRVLMGAGTDATSTITDGWWNGSTLYSGILNIQNVNDGTAQKYVSLAVSRHSNDIESGQLGFAKSRGSTANSKTTVGNGDTLGIITFQGADGSNLVEAARILVATDNPASGDDMPGRLQFYTTADGASSPTERMRINSNGAMLFDVESGGIMAMRVGTSAGVATDCFEINLSGATFACYVDVVTNQSAGYAGRTSQFLWYARRAPAGNSRGTVELSTNSLGSVNAGVVAVATITASATNPTGTLERFQITTNLATDSIYCIIRAIGNIPTLKILN